MDTHDPAGDPRREQLLAALDDNGVAAIFVKDLDGVYRLVNRACEEVWKLPRDEILGRTDAELLPEPCARVLRDNDLRVMETGHPLDVEESLDAPSGRYVFMSSKVPLRDERGAIVGICGVATDVTELKRVEASLRESEQRFRSLADGLPVLVWLSNTKNEGVWFNRTWLEFTGRELEEELGEGWFESMHPEDRPAAFEACEEAFRSRRSFSMSFRMRRADGEYRWVLDSGTPRFAADGRFEGFVGSCVDITERKETERMLREQAAALVEADRRKDEFLAMLSHELRNPLAPILLAAESLDGIDDPRVSEAASTICRQVDQMTRLVDDLLDVARITQGKIRLRSQPTSVARFLRVAVETIQPSLLDSSHELSYEPPAEDMMVVGDPERLAQVFANLLHNAAKFTPDGGRLDLGVSAEEDAVEITVRDNGCGIAREEIPYVFDLFHQTGASLDRANGGLGIGLTLVRRLVEMHGGSITVESAGPDQGSEFRVRLRRLGVETGQRPNGGASVPSSSMAPMRVLVVDDNRDVARVLSRILASSGHTVEVAYDGVTALDVAERFSPDGVILDIGLPGIDGVEVARRLRARTATRGIHIAAMSGYCSPADESRSEFDAWLMKPVSRDRIESMLRKLAGSMDRIDGKA